MDYIDITPYVKPRNVFNFNFSTILLFRCTKRKYAELFVKGKIFFNQPKNWIQIEKDGKAYYISRVENSYFTDFSNNITELDYESIEDNEKPVVMFINNPHKLFERVRDALKKIGLSEDEIIISPVEYIDKKVVSISVIPYPKELLLKDNYYSQQSISIQS